MPTRPSQSSEAQLLRWQRRRELIGARIRELRLEQGLSQESLALESGLSRNMIIGIEWGRKSVAYERLWDIAEVLGVGVDVFISEPTSGPQHRVHRGGRNPMSPSD
ncbi:helix-turn-helix transcriptional regulator [Paenarthrobacter sp. NPDC089322]|uniref:helix-turn-helix domain-containing protein n=1 Tax=Paenarthrobacter sp. NPDC089322 TaxID=3155065 RepID=UPI00343A7443